MTNKQTNRGMALLVALCLLLAFAPTGLAWADNNPMGVTVRIEGYDKTHVAPTPVQVTAFDPGDYGLPVSGLRQDAITPLHALLQLLVDGGYDLGEGTIQLDPTGMITTIFGEGDFAHSWMYSVNGAMQTGETAGPTQFALTEGDAVAFFCVDWMVGHQSWFDTESAHITVGQPLELTLWGLNLMNWLFYGDDTPSPMAGAALYRTDGVNMTNADQATGIVTDGAGKATLTFDTPGVYVVSAVRMSASDDTVIDLSRPYCKVEVSAEVPVTLPELPTQWASFRGNPYNMGVTDKATPTTPAQATLLWAKTVTGASATPNIPCIVDGNLIFSAGDTLYKVNKQTGATMAQQPMAAAASFGVSPITYGGGMIFAPISNGRIQAFDATTLQSLWVSEPMGGQSLSPIVYAGGYVYTGFWSGETADNSYVCLSVTDEDPASTTEVKSVRWKHTVKGGFYWAGGIVLGDTIFFGADDGAGGASGPAKVYALNRITGAVQDTIDIVGDQRSAIAYDEPSGRLYFTTKNGMLYSVATNEDGTFDHASLRAKAMESGWQCTGTPVVHDGRLYIGIGQGFDKGKLLVVNGSTLEPIYDVPLPGYPQGSALLSTAYQAETGKVFVYLTYNQSPGGLAVIQDGPGQTSAVAEALFTPGGAQAAYCLESPICDDEGTLYYHNDSGTMFAIGNRTEGDGTGGNDIPDFGQIVGTVSLSVRNDTFSQGAWTGTILSENPFEFAENDTMMTVILRALAKHGYGWTGQGGTVADGVDDYGITYLVSITKGGDTLGEFSGAPGSGWLGTHNDWFVSDGFSQIKPKDGDAITLEFTQNRGIDIGGTWTNGDTSLRALSASVGTLSPAFAGGTTSYTLELPGGTQSIRLTPKAQNRNFLVKTFLNETVTTNTEGNSFYPPNGDIPVVDGDVIYIGVGEKAWPSANKQQAQAANYTGTWYEITIDMGGGAPSGGGGGGGGGGTPAPPAPTATPAPNPWHNPYRDVTADDWFYDGVQFVATRGIMQGTGEGVFDPASPATRAMLVTMLHRYSGAPAPLGANPFGDVPAGEWYHDAVVWGEEQGIITGEGDGRFAPDAPLTREQIVVILRRYGQYKGKDVSQQGDLAPYTDATAIAPWAVEAMAWGRAVGLINGRSETTLAPGDTASRGEIAALLQRFLQQTMAVPSAT